MARHGDSAGAGPAGDGARPGGRAVGEFAALVKAEAVARADDLFRAAWGEPVRAGSREWRAKESSAAKMEMHGARRGLWSDFKRGDGGDILDFYAVQFLGMGRARDNFPRVVDELAAWLGLRRDVVPDVVQLEARRRAAREATERAEEDERRRKEAVVAAVVARAVPALRSPAETYLARRGVRWFPLESVAYATGREFGALVVWARDEDGVVRGGQQIAVTEDGGPAPVTPRKRTFGFVSGYPARFPGHADEDALVVAEGPETALSVWQATGCETWAVFGVGFFRTAPLPLGRRVILCPDRDAPGSRAADAFLEACHAHAARGVDLWIAPAPEPEASKRDLNDTLQRAGDAAVKAAVQAAKPFTPRDRRGRFTGSGAIAAEPVPMPEFVPVEEASERLQEVLGRALEAAVGWDELSDEPPPVVAVAASPGAGKSRSILEALAGIDRSRLSGDVVIYGPTLAQAEEAAVAAAARGVGWHVTRGRSARNPATGTPMCARSELAERVARAGLNVTGTLCRRTEEDGTVSTCPHFEACPYLRQWDALEPGPVVRLESAAYLQRGKDGSGRPVAVRIVDETVWRGFLRSAELRADAFTRAALVGGGRRRAAFERQVELINDRVQAARAVVTALQEGRSPVVDGFDAEAFEAFARSEEDGPTVLHVSPGDADAALEAAVKRFEAGDQEAGKRAALWRVLAEAERAGRAESERVQFVADYRGKRRDEDPRDVIRVHWRAAFPSDVPVILLDADADPLILEQMHPGAALIQFALRPNAEVVQVVDRTFSKESLKKPENRAAWVDVIRAEVARDRAHGARGVLVAASKEVVRWFFEDAGVVTEAMPDEEVRRVMAATEMHGARWLWFGPASLGLNAFETFGTAIVIGREELPVDALEDLGRAMFGDSGEPLQTVKPDAEGRRLMPHDMVRYLMRDGTGRAARVRMHPDPRVRALQMQAREFGTRQFVERLRLARAVDRKRVVIGSNVPLPGFPVDELVPFDELVPDRVTAAFLEAGGVLRLSPAGLAADAPGTFDTPKAAARHMEKLNAPSPLIEPYYRWGGIKSVVVEMRLEGQRGRSTKVLMLPGQDYGAVLAARYGPVKAWRVVGEEDPPVQEAAVVVPAVEMEFARGMRRAVEVGKIVAALEDPVVPPPAPAPARAGPVPVPRPSTVPEPEVEVEAVARKVLVILPEPERLQASRPMQAFLLQRWERQRALWERVAAAFAEFHALDEWSPDAWA